MPVRLAPEPLEAPQEVEVESAEVEAVATEVVVPKGQLDD